MKATSALRSGLAGACVMTLVHEAVKKVSPQAPRMDLLGMNAISKALKKADDVPGNHKLYAWALTGDIVSNSLFYSLVGVGRKKGAWLRGGLLGLAAGLGAVLLPKPLGLNQEYSNRTTQTQVMTVALYLLGGLVAAATIRALSRKKEEEEEEYAYSI